MFPEDRKIKLKNIVMANNVLKLNKPELVSPFDFSKILF